MDKLKKKHVTAWRRKKRVRNNLFGTAERPRLSVHRSHKHIYAQMIDDLGGRTLCSASTQGKEVKQEVAQGGDVKAAEVVGNLLAQRAVMQGIRKAVFDRGPYKYHGRVKALAEAARKAGLEF